MKDAYPAHVNRNGESNVPEEPLDPAEAIQRSLDLLNSTHEFPCPVMVKVIGPHTDQFIDAVVQVVREQLELPFDPPIRKREARGGRHVSVTIEPTFDDAQSVLRLYEHIRHVEGVIMVM